jgi:hypothetical protein
VDGGGDALGHFDLLLAHAIAANGLRQRPVGRENFGVKTREAIRKTGANLNRSLPALASGCAVAPLAQARQSILLLRNNFTFRLHPAVLEWFKTRGGDDMPANGRGRNHDTLNPSPSG